MTSIEELNPELQGIGRYEFGWADPDVAGASAQRGLNEAVVRDISSKKNEPQWMLDLRLKGLKLFDRKPMPTWGSDLSGIDFDNIKYFVRSSEKQANSWEDLPEDIKTLVLKVQEKSGFIPNVFLTLAHRPDEFRAFFAFHDALMEKDSGLTKAEREMIVVATSAENDCLYCVVAHGAILRIRAKNPLIADQIATNYRKADITPRQRAMLDFAVKVCNDARAVEDADFETLRGHGFSDEDMHRLEDQAD